MQACNRGCASSRVLLVHAHVMHRTVLQAGQGTSAGTSGSGRRAWSTAWSTAAGRRGWPSSWALPQPDAQRLITSFLQTFPQVLRQSLLFGV